MSEKCPMRPGGMYWDGEVPDTCHYNCFDKWDGLTRKPADHIDTLSDICDASPDGCHHDVDHNGEAIQRSPNPDDTWRGYGINYACTLTGEEQFVEEYEFHCDNNDPNFPIERNPYVYLDSKEV